MHLSTSLSDSEKHCPAEIYARMNPEAGTDVIIAALFVIAPSGKQPKLPSTVA